MLAATQSPVIEKVPYSENSPRWYLVGARFYDPVLGIWLSTDPAKDGINPYAMVGGDPINYIDPLGLWKWGLGVVMGYDSRNGFSMGFGAAAQADFGVARIDVDASTTKSFKNDSWTTTANVGAGADVGVLSVGGNLGYSYNSTSGSTLSYGAEAGAFGIGGGVGGAQYWSTGGDYMGSTFYAQTYQGAFGVRAYEGYEWGFGGQLGRGGYAGASGFGAYSEYSQNYGFSYGIKGNVASYENDNGNGYVSLMNGLFTLEARELAADDHYIHYSDGTLLAVAGTVSDGGDDEFVFVAHGNKSKIGMVDRNTGKVVSTLTPAQFAKMLKNGSFNYSGEKSIKLYSCQTGSGGSSGFAGQLKQYMGAAVSVTAPTTNVRYIAWTNRITGSSTALPFTWLKGDGQWVTY
jgi:hypothetical protein